MHTNALPKHHKHLFYAIRWNLEAQSMTDAGSPFSFSATPEDDISVLFSRMEKAVARLNASPGGSPARSRHQNGRHDSDDDMEKEEERLLDSSEKLRSLMRIRRGSGRDHDDHRKARSSFLSPSRKLELNGDNTPICLSPLSVTAYSMDKSPSTPSFLSHSAFAENPRGSNTDLLSASSSVCDEIAFDVPSAHCQYWDCARQSESSACSPMHTHGYSTPMPCSTPERMPGGCIMQGDGQEERSPCRSPATFSVLSEEEEKEEYVDTLVNKSEKPLLLAPLGMENYEDSPEVLHKTPIDIASSLVEVIESLHSTPIAKAQSKWTDEASDMHEVGCASSFLSELSIEQRFSGFRALAQFKQNASQVQTTSSLPSSRDVPAVATLCRHLAFIILRPDLSCGQVLELVLEVLRDEGLVVVVRQGFQIVADAERVANDESKRNSGDKRTEWKFADIQVVVDRQSKDRVLLVRFIIPSRSGEDGSGTTSWRGATNFCGVKRPHAGGEKICPKTRSFLAALESKIFGAAFNKRALCRRPFSVSNLNTDCSRSEDIASEYSSMVTVTENETATGGGEDPKLDRFYLRQLEDMAREEMHKALDGTIQQLEDYVLEKEKQCLQLKEFLMPMFTLYKLAEPPGLNEPLPLSYYPLNLLAACNQSARSEEESFADKSDHENVWAENQRPHRSGSLDKVTYMDALRDRAWRHNVMQCDAEMTACMQRKNLQIVDRMGRCNEYQLFLLETLRDNPFRTTVPLFHNFKYQIGHDGGVFEDEEVETPLYYCRCIVGSRPATLFITFTQITFVSKVCGFVWARRLPLDRITSHGMTYMHLGVKRAKAIALKGQASKIASPLIKDENCGMPLLESKSHGVAANDSISEESLVFSTMVDPENLLNFVKLLVDLNKDMQSHIQVGYSSSAEARKALPKKCIESNA